MSRLPTPTDFKSFISEVSSIINNQYQKILKVYDSYKKRKGVNTLYNIGNQFAIFKDIIVNNSHINTFINIDKLYSEPYSKLSLLKIYLDKHIKAVNRLDDDQLINFLESIGVPYITKDNFYTYEMHHMLSKNYTFVGNYFSFLDFFKDTIINNLHALYENKIQNGRKAVRQVAQALRFFQMQLFQYPLYKISDQLAFMDKDKKYYYYLKFDTASPYANFNYYTAEMYHTKLLEEL